MNEPVKIKIGRKEYIGKQKIAVYLTERSMTRLRKYANSRNENMSACIVSLMNDGIKARGDKL